MYTAAYKNVLNSKSGIGTSDYYVILNITM